MSALAVLAVFILLQLWGSGSRLHRDAWFRRGYAVLAWVPAGWPRTAMVILPPVFLVALCAGIASALPTDLPRFALDVLVLLYTMGRGDFNADLRAYLRNWRMGDFDAAAETARCFTGDLPGELPDSPRELHNSVRTAVFYRGFERWFAVVFWYLFAGPAVALMYRLIFLLARQPEATHPDRQLCSSALYYLEWLPLRILGPAFCVVGNFQRCARVISASVTSSRPTEELLDAWGRAALSSGMGVRKSADFVVAAGDELRDAGLLLLRSALLWLLLILIGGIL